MTKVLVDSDILIDFLRTGKGALPKLLKAQKDGKIELFISCVSVLELFAGKSSKAIKSELAELIDAFTVVPLARELGIFAGELKRDHNLTMVLADLVVGATAVFIGAKLATRNRRHYLRLPKLRFYPLITLPSEPPVSTA